MADYVELLRRGLGNNPSGPERGEIYGRARAALLDKLRQASMPPRDITKERLLLEEAIRQVEAEAAERFRDNAKRLG
jgi:hypothetical protein